MLTSPPANNDCTEDHMATQKFSNFSIDHILGDSSSTASAVDHPSSPRDLPAHVTRLDRLYRGGHGEHAELMMNLHPSSTWAGMYSCCSPASCYQMSFNSCYYACQQWPLTIPVGDASEDQCQQTACGRQRNRVRTVFTDIQTQQLERLFAITDYPTADARAELAESSGLSQEIVRVWFKNRRARRKRQSANSEQNQLQDSD